MAGNAFALTVTARFTKSAISTGVVNVTGTEGKNNINAGRRMALNTSDLITGEFHSVCGHVRGCVRASEHLYMTQFLLSI